MPGQVPHDGDCPVCGRPIGDEEVCDHTGDGPVTLIDPETGQVTLAAKPTHRTRWLTAPPADTVELRVMR